jgi:branched-chain amino acid transport system ATP-binding protein
VNLTEWGSVEARDLPYGAQNRLEIARALALQPRLLLLDEPAAGLNPAERAELRQLIQTVHEEGVTIAMVEHDVRMVTGLCRRVIVLDHGEKIADGTSEDVIEDPLVVAAYFGEDDSEEVENAG